MTLSIIVCTTGKRPILLDCLNSLSPSKGVEVIVVNNSKTNFKFKTKHKVIQESKLGLSIARNTGWKKAKGKFIAYIDDDSIADKNWIKNILAFIKSHPKVSVFGGPYSRHSLVRIPSWIPNDYGILNNGNKTRKLNIGSEWLSGTNMIFKKSLLKKVGGFNKKFGMSASNISYGEETDLQMRLNKSNIDIWHVPNIKVSHLLDHRKLNIFWQIKDSFIRGRDYQKLKNKKDNSHRNNQPKININYLIPQRLFKAIQLTSYALGSIYQKVVK